MIFSTSSASPNDTLVVYSTDNGPHCNSWPDGGMTPFRSEKNTNWEGAFRVPLLVRWPGKIEAGSVANGIVQHHDWLPTFLADGRRARCRRQAQEGLQGDRPHLQEPHRRHSICSPYLTGQTEKSPRNFFFYFSDDGDVLGLRFDNWKIVFMEQRCQGTLQVWAEPFVRLRVPKIFNLRTDPYEFADVTSNTYWDWIMNHAFFIYAAQAAMAKFVETFKEFPAIQKPNTFTVDDALRKLSEAPSAG